MTAKTEFMLEVYGYLWEGSRAVSSYTVPQAFGSDDHGSAERAAGDFQALIDWRLVRIDTDYLPARGGGLSRRVETYKTLRGFRNGMRPSRFYRLANGF